MPSSRESAHWIEGINLTLLSLWIAATAEPPCAQGKSIFGSDMDTHTLFVQSKWLGRLTITHILKSKEHTNDA